MSTKDKSLIIVVLVLVCVAVIIWGHHRLELLLLVAFLAPLTVIHVGSMALVSTCCWGIAIERLSIFYGGPLCRFNVRGIPIEIGYLPIGGSITFRRYDDGTTSNDGFRNYDHFHPWQRLVIILSGPSLLLLLGCALIGSKSLVETVQRFYPTFVAGTMSPGSDGVSTLAAYLSLLEHGNYQIAFGLLAVVLAVLNLLPLPTMNGGEALMELTQMLNRRRFAPKMVVALRVVSIVIHCVIAAAWAFSLILLLFFH
ncbi:MAG: site-2 protease family protein [Phycisphaerae bacterium]|nr:site-2 protease family protein [Phycisphaerae bacterium]